MLDTLFDRVLIGIDLWAKIAETLPAPPTSDPGKQTIASACEIDRGTLTRAERQRLSEFLRAELATFEGVRGPTDRIEHRIRVTTRDPIKQCYRPQNPAMQASIDREVAQMLEDGVIEPSQSVWSSPVVIVKKRNGQHRFCVDFRRVNEVSEQDVYPLPQITATLDKLRGARYLLTLDLKSGYWQVPRAPESKRTQLLPCRRKALCSSVSCRSGCTSRRPRFNVY